MNRQVILTVFVHTYYAKGIFLYPTGKIIAGGEIVTFGEPCHRTCNHINQLVIPVVGMPNIFVIASEIEPPIL